MFSFFQKKTFLVDYLHGLVDIHNHILPGLDDGAKTVEESIVLINEFSKFGVKNFVFTPHIMDNYYPNTPETIKKSFDLLRSELETKNMDHIQTDYAAEHMIDENFENMLLNKTVMPLKKEYLLIEMSYLQPSISFNAAIHKIASESYFPILAHPERYIYYHNTFKTYQFLKSKGILFQLNLLSLGGYYGTEIQKVALKLLGKGLVDFVSSDLHNTNQLNQLKETKITTSTLNLVLPVIENTILSFY